MTIKTSPNTECVYETIGNYPVVDQFDVLYTGMLSGTYMDNYITGSLLTRNIFLGTFEQGDRGLAFSKLDENKEYPADITNSANWNSYNFQPWTERSGNIRNLRIFSSSERYYDSQVPSPIDLAIVLGGNYFDPLSPTKLIYIGDDDSPPTNTPLGFTESFPFEAKFNNVARINVFNETIFSYNVAGSPFPIIWEGVSRKQKEAQVKVGFGFGDLDRRYKSGSTWYGSKNLLKFKKIATNTAYGPVIRGWKYGLVDGNPHYTSTIFRRDRYGQFRDVLEQRCSITSITDPANSPTRYFGSVEQPALTPSQFEEIPSYFYDPPVKVSFVKPDVVSNKLVYLSQEPETTWSSNVSFYATSSLPYFDGEARNRGPITTNIVSSSITFTITSDPFKNLTLLQSV